MPNHQMILSDRQIAALADACNIDVRHIEKHADEEFGNQLDAFAHKQLQKTSSSKPSLCSITMSLCLVQAKVLRTMLH